MVDSWTGKPSPPPRLTAYPPDMRCDHCHEREAVVHLTQITGDQSVQVHLCEKCSAEKGIEPATALVKSPVGGLLAQLTFPALGDPAIPQARCPRCGAGIEDLRAAGRLGCGECWEVFQGPLTDLVRRLHGATRHTGSRPAGPPSARAGTAPDLSRLREQLRDAVAAEDFERAARLRDELRAAQ
jgi:protein arginine kinase activator